MVKINDKKFRDKVREVIPCNEEDLFSDFFLYYTPLFANQAISYGLEMLDSEEIFSDRNESIKMIRAGLRLSGHMLDLHLAIFSPEFAKFDISRAYEDLQEETEADWIAVGLDYLGDYTDRNDYKQCVNALRRCFFHLALRDGRTDEFKGMLVKLSEGEQEKY